MSILIIGGDSRLAKSFVLRYSEHNIYRTSRRSALNANEIFLELNEIDDFNIPKDVTSAVIMGGVTNYQACVNDYSYAYNINCVAVPSLIKKLLENNIYVCFISTNTVFKFTRGLPKETDLVCPGFSYASLKAQTEQVITRISVEVKKEHLLSILRLTKNVCNRTSPFNDWIDKLGAKQPIYSLSDLYFAPITFFHSADVIFKLLSQKKPGIFHFSGEHDISYAEFALQLVDYLSIDKALVKVVKSSDIGINLVYNHPITALDMTATSSRLGISPIPLVEVFNYIKKFIKINSSNTVG